MKRLFSPASLLFIALLTVLLIGGRSRFFQDPGTFWHTVVGEQILGQRGFFDTDPFTFTYAGQPWIPHQWLGECIMALTHRLAGWDSLLLLAATLLAGTFAVLGARLMRIGGLHPSLAIVLVALAVAASSGHFHIRPHLATIVCFAITFALLNNAEANRTSLSRLGWLIPLFAFWANCHGGMLGGLATLMIVLAGWVIGWWFRLDSPLENIKQLGWLVLLVFGCAAVAFVNPYGWRLPQTWLDIYRMPMLPQLIREHAPIDLSDTNAWMLLGFGGAYLALLAGVRLRELRATWLVPIIWLALAITRVRHAPLFAVSALIAIADFFPQTRWAERLSAAGSDLYVPPASNHRRKSWTDWMLPLVLPVLFVGVAIAFQATHTPVPVLGVGWAKLDDNIWPTELLDELREHQFDRPGGTRIFNEYAYGGFLIYHAPGYRVFIDDRCELYGDVWLNGFVNEIWLDPHAYIEAAEQQYGRFDFALVTSRDSRIGFMLDDYFSDAPGWEVVKRTATATLYRRKPEPVQPLD